MSGQTTAPRAAELTELDRFRLDEDLNYRELGRRVGVSHATLQRLLTDPAPTPFDRTLHKIRRFLERQRPARKVRRA